MLYVTGLEDCYYNKSPTLKFIFYCVIIIKTTCLLFEFSA